MQSTSDERKFLVVSPNGMKLVILKEWISDDTVQLIRKKWLVRLQGGADEYKQLQKLYSRHDRQTWADDNATETETTIDSDQLKEVSTNLRLRLSHSLQILSNRLKQWTIDQRPEDEARALEGILRSTP